MRLNSYVSFQRKVIVNGEFGEVQEFGQVIAFRTAKYGKKREFFSVKSKSGVYSSANLTNINEVEAKQVKYLDLNPRKHKKGIEYKLARKARLAQAKKERVKASKSSVQEVVPAKSKKRK